MGHFVVVRQYSDRVSDQGKNLSRPSDVAFDSSVRGPAEPLTPALAGEQRP
jgi:hypothetical protein